MAQRQILQLVERATDSLPDIYRTVFVARVIEGLSIEETADLLGVRPETVKTRLHRARILVRKALDEQIGPVLLDAFPFAGRRCERLTTAVMKRLGVSGLTLGQDSADFCGNFRRHPASNDRQLKTMPDAVRACRAKEVVMLIRPTAALAALCLLGAAPFAQAADKPTDPQIAHIAYTAGVLDVEAAKQAAQEIEEQGGRRLSPRTWCATTRR